MYNYSSEIKKLPSKIKSYVEKDKDLQVHINKYKLDVEEIQLLIEDEMGERETIPNFEQEKEKLVQIAKNTITLMQKKKQLTIRIADQDLLRLKSKASQQGIPYQTLLSSVIHQYVYS